MPTDHTPERNETLSSLFLSSSFLSVSATLAVIFAAVAHTYLTRNPISASATACIYLAFALQLMLSLAPAFRHSLRQDSTLVGYTALAVVPLWCVPYLLYAAGTGDFRWLALLKLASVAAVPTLIYSRF